MAQEQDTVVSWQDNDSIVMAPLQVQSVGATNYEELTRIPSSLDLENPDNVTTSIEYDPVMGCYVMRTRMGDIDIATPYMMTMDDKKWGNIGRLKSVRWSMTTRESLISPI